MQSTPSKTQTFFHEHKPLALALLGGIVIIIILIVVIFTTSSSNDGVTGDNSSPYLDSVAADEKALKETDAFQITKYLPITSADPSYNISYSLDKDNAGNYSLSLTLNAFSASARDAMIKRLLSEDFGKYDPLDYKITLENYYNPFTNSTLSDLKAENYPTNITKGSLYSFGDSNITVQTLIHTLYDGSTNTYRFVLENGEPKVKPQLFFTYADLPSLDHSTVKSLNTLE
ncbi:hypothetical protein IKE86_00070 [Candidatus Saccharibacteria bacterium]|nr:hypothetical protein [Candidatus Saccharibacteria bacterium]